MPTISQLPAATAVTSSDLVPISQNGSVCSASVGTLLASTQPAIIVESPSLIGRISLGAGGPEQIAIGTGVSVTDGVVIATGLDHAGFPVVSSLASGSDLVICNQGAPMLMPTSMLRGLFSAGESVTITADGTISATAGTATSGTGSPLDSLQVVTGLTAQDLVAVAHAGTDCAITYANLLDGMTIEQAPAAVAAANTDTIWVAQGSNVMARQTFGAVWAWIASQLPTYSVPVVEITASTSLNASAHNGRILICSQSVTLTPATAKMGSGFQCTIINASTGIVTLGTGFVSSTGGLTLAPEQTASICCVTYSGGTIAFASLAGTATAVAPGQVSSLSDLSTTSTTVTLSWQAPTSGGSASSYAVQYRISGTSAWTSGATVIGATTCSLAGLAASTSYDVIVQAVNTAGTGLSSSILTVTTAAATSTQAPVPPQVTGLVVAPVSSSAVQVTWSAQTGTGAATSFTIQYRVTGSTTWTSSVPGVSGTTTTISGLQAATSYDFSIIGVDSSGSGPLSATVTAVTEAATVGTSVSSITWNLLPSGPYTHASGAIGVNAHVTPSTAPIQFGFSLSSTTLPSSWTAAVLVNTNLWGAYAPTPTAAGTWFVWAEGIDGSCPTVSTTSFLVQ